MQLQQLHGDHTAALRRRTTALKESTEMEQKVCEHVPLHVLVSYLMCVS